jgi:hypothetical protein
MYEYIPAFDLAIQGAPSEADAYVESASEDWVPGALFLDGKRTCRIAHDKIRADFAVDLTAWIAKPQVSKKDVPGKPWRITGKQAIFPGELRKTIDFGATNILIETIVRIDTGQVGGSIARKHDGRTGYQLAVADDGRVAFTISAGGRSGSVASVRALNDGRWHHVLAEFDRSKQRGTMYIDGKAVAHAKCSLPADASLGNEADFVVGEGVRGAIDFLRLCQGTLEDAETTIEELHAWQTAGPVTRDFCGHAPKGRRDIGAVERVD